MNDMSWKTTVVVGASRGLGRGIARAFAEAGAPVVAVARTAAAFPEPADGAGPLLNPEIAGAVVVELVQADAATVAPAYLLTGAGLQKLP
jgi:NAD(P)-dependent dehydrogenase (short-subunit alcohol dehydrogenase family)